MNTLGIDEAAAILRMHPDTVRERAAAGIIPGAKIGKAWCFVEADLIAFIRSQYKGEPCRSIGEEQSIGSTYADAADELGARLSQATGKPRSASTTKLRLAYGARSKQAGP